MGFRRNDSNYGGGKVTYISFKPVYVQHRRMQKTMKYNEASKAAAIAYGRSLKLQDIGFLVLIEEEDGKSRYIAGYKWLESNGYTSQTEEVVQ